jgi:hypothetical protein
MDDSNQYNDFEMEEEEYFFVPYDTDQQPKQPRTPEPTRPARDVGQQFHLPYSATPRLPSRHSGGYQNLTYMNKCPKDYPVSDEWLLSHGLTRSQHAKARRATGPNDPENVLICNLRQEKLSWKAISNELNEQRVKDGKKPTYTANCVQNRFNRNAPILFAAAGIPFIPTSEQNRLRKQGFRVDTERENGIRWTPDLDKELIKSCQFVDSQRWARVAQKFGDSTNVKITAMEAAKRIGML